MPDQSVDEQIAEMIMGWTPWASRGTTPDCWRTNDPESPTFLMRGWKPSEDLNLAMRAYEEFRKRRGWGIYWLRHFGTDVWRCELTRPSEQIEGIGKTAAEAICAAIILASVSP